MLISVSFLCLFPLICSSPIRTSSSAFRFSRTATKGCASATLGSSSSRCGASSPKDRASFDAPRRPSGRSGSRASAGASVAPRAVRTKRRSGGRRSRKRGRGRARIRNHRRRKMQMHRRITRRSISLIGSTNRRTPWRRSRARRRGRIGKGLARALLAPPARTSCQMASRLSRRITMIWCRIFGRSRWSTSDPWSRWPCFGRFCARCRKRFNTTSTTPYSRP